MKSISLEDHGQFKARELILTVMRSPGKQGSSLDYAEMNKRVRVMEAVERLSDTAITLVLEDADHATLFGAVKGFQFALADPGLFKVLKQIEDAADFTSNSNQVADPLPHFRQAHGNGVGSQPSRTD